jgi:hypothetical protein
VKKKSDFTKPYGRASININSLEFYAKSVLVKIKNQSLRRANKKKQLVVHNKNQIKNKVRDD